MRIAIKPSEATNSQLESRRKQFMVEMNANNRLHKPEINEGLPLISMLPPYNCYSDHPF